MCGSEVKTGRGGVHLCVSVWGNIPILSVMTVKVHKHVMIKYQFSLTFYCTDQSAS